MNAGDIDRLETEAEKAITKLAELAIEHNNDSIKWRNKAISNHKMRCAHMHSCSKYEMDFENQSTNKKQLIAEMRGALDSIGLDVWSDPEEMGKALMRNINSMKDCINLLEKK